MSTTLAERDSYILGLLNTVAPLTGRAAILEAIRVGSAAQLLLPGMVQSQLETDITGIQTAVTALANPSTRTSVAAQLPAAKAHGQHPLNPKDPGPVGAIPQLWATPTTDAAALTYQLRVLNAGG